MKTIGVILARGGSKRLPKKNIMQMCGCPLIYYTIAAAKKSDITDVVVSSDDDEILRTAEKYDTECIKRPSELAQDETPSFLALKHAVESIEHKKKIKYEKVVLLQPTSPLRSADMINQCLFINSDAVATLERTDVNEFKLNGAVFVIKREIMDMIKNPQKYLIDDLIYLKNKNNILICTLVTRNMIDIDNLEDFHNVEKEMTQQLKK